MWWSTNVPPSVTNATDVDLLPNSTGGTSILTTIASPAIIPGGTYYLGVQNANNVTVNYGIKVNFNVSGQFSGGPGVLISSITASGSATTLTWTGPAGAQFQVQWTDDLTQPWQTAPDIIGSSTSDFSYTDDGTTTAPLGPRRFYRVVQISQ